MITQLGIDLGTTHLRITLPQRGIVINEPTVAALSARDQSVIAVGNEAKRMLGRTPESIVASYPMRNGAIASFQITEKILKHYINSLSGRIRFIRPEVVISIPSGITSTERRAVVDVAIKAGARAAYVIKAPVAAALGINLPIAQSVGHMIIDIGGGKTDVAVISLGDVVSSGSIRIGGVHFDQSIINYIRKKHNLIIGEQTAEEIKIKIGAALALPKPLTLEVSGSNTITGLPEGLLISTTDVVTALKPDLAEIIQTIKQVLQRTPPELSADIMDHGMVVCGGGALLRGIETLLTKVTGVPVQVADDPLLVVARGCGEALTQLSAFKKSLLWAK